MCDVLGGERLYCVTADYRKNNARKPRYYVVAKTKRDAKRKFARKISWLDIYNVEEVEKELTSEIIENYKKRVLIWEGHI